MSAKRTHERAAVRVARKLVSEIRRRRLRPGGGGPTTNVLGVRRFPNVRLTGTPERMQSNFISAIERMPVSPA